MGPKIGYFAFESFGFGFHGFEDHSMTQAVFLILHKSFVSSGGFLANSLKISEENK